MYNNLCPIPEGWLAKHKHTVPGLAIYAANNELLGKVPLPERVLALGEQLYCECESLACHLVHMNYPTIANLLNGSITQALAAWALHHYQETISNKPLHLTVSDIISLHEVEHWGSDEGGHTGDAFCDEAASIFYAALSQKGIPGLIELPGTFYGTYLMEILEEHELSPQQLEESVLNMTAQELKDRYTFDAKRLSKRLAEFEQEKATVTNAVLEECWELGFVVASKLLKEWILLSNNKDSNVDVRKYGRLDIKAHDCIERQLKELQQEFSTRTVGAGLHCFLHPDLVETLTTPAPYFAPSLYKRLSQMADEWYPALSNNRLAYITPNAWTLLQSTQSAPDSDD